MTTQKTNEEELLKEEESHQDHIPEVAKKVSKFWPGAFQNGSKFGKWATNFNPPNKQRPGRAAGRGR